MLPQKIVIWIMSGIGGAIGLFAPVGVVKWLLATEPEDAGILTFFFLPCGASSSSPVCLSDGRLGMMVGGKRVLPR
jgi:hypothetical protein